MSITSKRYQGTGPASGKAAVATADPFGSASTALRSGKSGGSTKRRAVKRRSRRAKR